MPLCVRISPNLIGQRCVCVCVCACKQYIGVNACILCRRVVDLFFSPPPYITPSNSNPSLCLVIPIIALSTHEHSTCSECCETRVIVNCVTLDCYGTSVLAVPTVPAGFPLLPGVRAPTKHMQIYAQAKAGLGMF